MQNYKKLQYKCSMAAIAGKDMMSASSNYDSHLGPVYTVPDKFLSVQVFVRIGLAFTRYLPIRTNICSFIRTKTCTATKDKL